jgi:DNA-binding protein H-NS
MMAKWPSLASMKVEELLALQGQLHRIIRQKKDDLQRQLKQLNGDGKLLPGKRGPKPGAKVSPKFRGPNGELWTGRGLKPRWLMAELKKGKKLEQFAIRR